MSIAWLNFLCMHLSILLFAYTSILSSMPITRAEKRGERAWTECYWLRQACFAFIFIVILNAILWLWFPIPELAWPLSLNPLISILIAVIIAIPSLTIMLKAMIDGGEEHWKPKKGRKMHGGIYNYIRHPGALGEMPLYIALAFFLNSVFLVLWMTLFVLIYTPIAIYYEEKDLVKRFGEKYIRYKERTGAVFPKFRSREKRKPV